MLVEASNDNRLIVHLLQMLTELGWKPPSGDVIDEIANGGLLTTAQAATICEVTDWQETCDMVDRLGAAVRIRRKISGWVARAGESPEPAEGILAGLVAQGRTESYATCINHTEACRMFPNRNLASA